ncbi:hypothetical protein PsYK624_104510 [Phanerochaete sordida]|uniref:Uncharacterized protein n=1 Tax=Phanerochaete sordida TaxID=48140 RepID=A0A9P3GEM6_9APHY|nr:hypothetical protein PsYK624_104510 [Phanerochaete sordida]
MAERAGRSKAKAPASEGIKIPQELIDRIVDHVAAPLRDSSGHLILRKNAQIAKDLFSLTLVPRLEAGSSRVLFGEMTIGDGERTVSAFAGAVKISPRMARAITSLIIDLDDCDVYRSAPIEDLEVILASLKGLVKLRIHDSRGNTRPSLRRHGRPAEGEVVKREGFKIEELTLSSLDVDAVLECLALFDSVRELNLESIFCSSVPIFGLAEDYTPRQIQVQTLRVTGCHPAIAGLLSKAINTQYPVETIGLYDISFALEYNPLSNLLRNIGKDSSSVTLEVTNRWARNPHSVHPKVLFSALADFWSLRTLHIYEDSDVDECEKLLFFCLIPHLPSDLHRFRLVLRYYKSVIEHLQSSEMVFAIETFLARYPRLATFEITVDLREFANPVDPATETHDTVAKLKTELSYQYRDRVAFVTACSPYYVDLTHHKISLGTLDM